MKSLTSAALIILIVLCNVTGASFLSFRGAFASGREIDIYTQYPAPDGGQGKNMPSNPFRPMMEVYVYAYVTYNLSPLEGRIVTFEVEHGEWHFLLSNSTDFWGKAYVLFRIPWPDVEPDARVIGVWNVTAAVSIAGMVVEDTLWFHVSLTDLNCDGKVDIKDVGAVAYSFGSFVGHPRWNPDVDVVFDEAIDVKDIARVAKDYGWHSDN